MDKEHLLKCPKLDNTARDLPKTVLGCQKTNGINPRSAIRQQQQQQQQQQQFTTMSELHHSEV